MFSTLKLYKNVFNIITMLNITNISCILKAMDTFYTYLDIFYTYLDTFFTCIDTFYTQRSRMSS